MGNFTHTITLFSAGGGRPETLEALVDTGATFTSVPAAILERLGVVPHRSVKLRLANGQNIQRLIGQVRVQLNGAEETIICVFGENDSPPAIGAHTLEAFLLAVDPVAERLVPREGYW